MPPFKTKLVTNERLKPFNPVVCGNEQCAPNQHWGPTSRHFWLLHFVVSGKGFFQTPRGNYHLSQGDVFVIRPYEMTYYIADAETPWEYNWVGFTSDIPLPSILTSSDTFHAPYLAKYFKNAVFTQDFDDNDLTTGSYVYFLSGIIWQICGVLMRADKRKKSSAESYVRAAISIIEAEYATGITVSSLAERLHLNRSYFSEIFCQITGMPPHKYLTDYRMRRAEELLTIHGCNVTVTALSVGYPDVFAFSRAYKHHFGYSPTRREPEEPHSPKE